MSNLGRSFWWQARWVPVAVDPTARQKARHPLTLVGKAALAILVAAAVLGSVALGIAQT
jgi:hypothetical protein